MSARAAILLSVAAGCGRFGFDDTVHADAPGAVDAALDTSRDATDAASDTAMPGPIALAQQSALGQAMNGVTVTLAAPSTAGTLLVAAIASNSVNPVGLPPGWTQAAMIGGAAGCYAAVAYFAANPGNLMSFTFTQSSNVPVDAQVTEWTNVAATTPIDALGNAAPASGTTSLIVQTAASTTVAGDLGIAVFCEDTNNPTLAAGPGWTSLATSSAAPSVPSVETDYQLGLGVGVASETATSSQSGKYSAIIAAFRR